MTKLSSTGQQLLFSTYLGGAGADHGGTIAVDSSGTVYVTGYTWSSNFPTQNAYQPSIAGPCNAYVARFSASGDSLLFSTYLGGSGCTMAYPETGQAIALGAQENAYVAGVTSSSDFPQLNAVQPQLQGSTDVFVAEFNSAGALMFSTYLGGSGVDVGNAIALDASGAIYVAGYTYSTDFPVTAGAIQLTNAGVCDAFLFKLSPMGDALLYATYVGGSGRRYRLRRGARLQWQCLSGWMDVVVEFPGGAFGKLNAAIFSRPARKVSKQFDSLRAALRTAKAKRVAP